MKSELLKLEELLRDLGNLYKWDMVITASVLVQNMAFNADKSRIYIGGTFTNFNGSSYCTYFCAMYTSSNTYDTAFTPNPSGGTGTGVFAITRYNTSVYIGGVFTSYSGTGRFNVLKMAASNGALDATFNTSTGTNGQVNALAVSSDGTYLYIGGSFTTYKSSSSGYNLIKVSASTAAMETTNFNTTANSGPNSTVNSLTLSADGTKLYVGGQHDNYRGSGTAPGLSSVSTTNGALSW